MLRTFQMPLVFGPRREKTCLRSARTSLTCYRELIGYQNIVLNFVCTLFRYCSFQRLNNNGTAQHVQVRRLVFAFNSCLHELESGFLAT